MWTRPYHRWVTDSRPSSGAGPSVCPFVALAEDRDRRADAPDEGNRCYAERAPRRRDLVYQSEYCYAADFAQCSVFLAWAARSAAEPAFVTEAAQKAWGSGIAAPEGPTTEKAADEAPAKSADGAEPLPSPTPEGGLFGPAESDDDDAAGGSQQLDWVSATAWAEAPWDERAESEADELEAIAAEEAELEAKEAEDEEPAEEATQAPKVPAAIPMRRRKPPQEPIRSRGSGEWAYADPPGREPLVSRRSGITPTVLLAVLGVLVVSIVIFLVAASFGGGDDGPQPIAAASPSPGVSLQPLATVPPRATAEPTVEPSPTPTPKPRYYRIKPGDSLTAIAARFDVKVNHLQCLNGILNKNLIRIDQRIQIPPKGFSCPPGWRKATPEP